jgi:hypothetical protein
MHGASTRPNCQNPESDPNIKSIGTGIAQLLPTRAGRTMHERLGRHDKRPWRNTVAKHRVSSSVNQSSQLFSMSMPTRTPPKVEFETATGFKVGLSPGLAIAYLFKIGSSRVTTVSPMTLMKFDGSSPHSKNTWSRARVIANVKSERVAPDLAMWYALVRETIGIAAKD